MKKMASKSAFINALKKKKDALDAKEEAQESTPKFSPFFDSRQHWNEVYGSSIHHMRNWRNFSFMLVVVILGMAVSLIYEATTSKVIPYVIVLDERGNKLHAGKVDQYSPPQDKMIINEIRFFIEKFREITTDLAYMKRNIDWVYSHLSSQTSAKEKLNDYFRKNNPFQIVTTETRVVSHIQSVLKVTSNTWIAEWTEVSRSAKDGKFLRVTPYKAKFTIKLEEPQSELAIEKNFFGVFVTEIEWTQVRQQERDNHETY